MTDLPHTDFARIAWFTEDRADIVLEAAQELADARKAFAEAFLLHRINQRTDKQAEAMAQVECGERVILAQARYEIAARELGTHAFESTTGA